MITSSFIFFPIALLVWAVTRPFDRRLRALQWVTCMWGSLHTAAIPGWRVKVYGKENLRGKDARVIVCNHQSLLDILVLCRLHHHFKFVSKAEIFKVPLLGWIMYLNRYIGIVRGTIKSMAKMMEDCAQTLQEGSSVLIFPEGTRSEDGNLKSFRTGAFSLAKDGGKPILPVVIYGTGTVMGKNTLKMKAFHRMAVSVLPELPYSSFADQPLIKTANMVQQMMADELDALKNKMS